MTVAAWNPRLGRTHYRAQRTVRGLEALLVHALQGLEVVRHYPVERRDLGAARLEPRRASSS